MNTATNISTTNAGAGFEIIDAAELAKRLKVPASWVRDYVRTRAVDPIPHIRFGRYVRFEWQHGSALSWSEAGWLSKRKGKICRIVHTR